MSDTVLTAIISGVVAIVVSVMAVLQELNRRTTKRIRHQVENDHSTNMRVENDERYEEQQDFNKQVIGALFGIRADISEMKPEIKKNTDRTNQLWSKYVRKSK